MNILLELTAYVIGYVIIASVVRTILKYLKKKYEYEELFPEFAGAFWPAVIVTYIIVTVVWIFTCYVPNCIIRLTNKESK